MIKRTIPFIIFLLILYFMYRGLSLSPTTIPSPLLDKPVPEFSLPSLLTSEHNLTNNSFQGENYLINVWATWCIGCRIEHDYLKFIAISSGLPILGLNWRDDKDLALNWLTELGNPYQDIAFDPDGRVSIDFGVYGAPETYLVRADGTIAYKHIAPLNADVWNNEFIPRIIDLCGNYPCD
jgi:cytochrome c biogenesis protein CcmG/thiol:disulfide interchange protein DsbE